MPSKTTKGANGAPKKSNPKAELAKLTKAHKAAEAGLKAIVDRGRKLEAQLVKLGVSNRDVTQVYKLAAAAIEARKLAFWKAKAKLEAGK